MGLKGIHDDEPEKQNILCVNVNGHKCAFYWMNEREEAAINKQMALCPNKIQTHRYKGSNLTKRKKLVEDTEPQLYIYYVKNFLRLGFLICKMKMTPASQTGEDEVLSTRSSVKEKAVETKSSVLF